MIKRGVNVDYVHFHSAPAVNEQSIDNVKRILNVLSEYQLQSNFDYNLITNELIKRYNQMVNKGKLFNE